MFYHTPDKKKAWAQHHYCQVFSFIESTHGGQRAASPTSENTEPSPRCSECQPMAMALFFGSLSLSPRSFPRPLPRHAEVLSLALCLGTERGCAKELSVSLFDCCRMLLAVYCYVPKRGEHSCARHGVGEVTRWAGAGACWFCCHFAESKIWNSRKTCARQK